MNKKVNIYALIVKGDDKIRYIGKTKYSIKRRLQLHLSRTKYHQLNDFKLTHKENWIIKNNYNIDIILIENCLDSDWIEREKYYIEKYNNLTNISLGGDGGILRFDISYDDCKKWVNQNLIFIKSIKAWDENKSKLPSFIPKAPHIVYNNNGWSNWNDFLNSSNYNSIEYYNNLYLSYDDAQLVVKKLGIKSSVEYKKLGFANLNNYGLPLKPFRFYKNKGWVNWNDYIGCSQSKTKGYNIYSYEEMKKLIKDLKFTNLVGDYKEWAKKQNDNKIPLKPRNCYTLRGTWISTSDFLNKKERV